jgi:hypothetical protein
MAHGEDDFPHLVRQAQTMEAALRTAGGEVERMVLRGRTHFTASLATSEPDMPWLSRAKAWIESHDSSTRAAPDGAAGCGTRTEDPPIRQRGAL